MDKSFLRFPSRHDFNFPMVFWDISTFLFTGLASRMWRAKRDPRVINPAQKFEIWVWWISLQLLSKRLAVLTHARPSLSSLPCIPFIGDCHVLGAGASSVCSIGAQTSFLCDPEALEPLSSRGAVGKGWGGWRALQYKLGLWDENQAICTRNWKEGKCEEYLNVPNVNNK